MRAKKPNLFIRGTTWWVRFRDHRGKRIRKSTSQRDRALAEQAARQLIDEHFAAATRLPSATLELLLAQWLANVERRGKAETTLGFYVAKVRHLVRVFGADFDINAFTLADTEGYIDRRATEAPCVRIVVAPI